MWTLLFWVAVAAFTGLVVRSENDWAGVGLAVLFLLMLTLWMDPLLPASRPFVLPVVSFYV